jgi:hypothetical protein
LTYFCTELSGVDLTGVLVRIQTIHSISVEYVWHTSLDSRLQELLEEVFCLYSFLHLESCILLELVVERFEFSFECIFETLSVLFDYFVWIKE